MSDRPTVRTGRKLLASMAALLGLCLVVATASAAEPERGEQRMTLTAGDRSPDASSRPLLRAGASKAPFIGHRGQQRLVPQVSLQMESLSAFRQSAGPAGDLADHALFDDLSDHVRRRVERQTRKAVKTALLEATDIERRIDEWKDRRRSRSGGDGGGPSSSGIRKPDFDVSFRGLTPVVRVRYGLERGSLKFSFNAEGSAGVTFRTDRMTRTRFHVGFDGDDDEIRFQYRFGY